jgi:hypothetical protein
MRTHRSGDLWTEAGLLRVEEMLAEARAITAQRALVRDARPPRRTARLGGLRPARGRAPSMDMASAFGHRFGTVGAATGAGKGEE